MRYKSCPVHTKYDTQAKPKGTGKGEIKLKWSGEGTEYQAKSRHMMPWEAKK